ERAAPVQATNTTAARQPEQPIHHRAPGLVPERRHGRMSASLYIGLISGTSMDGIDCVLVDLPPGQGLRVLDYHCAPMPSPLRDTLLALCANQGLDLIQLGNADVAVAEHFADAVGQLLAKRRLKPTQIAAIGSHGQTVWHQPPQRGSDEPAFTLQIGDPNIIAARTG